MHLFDFLLKQFLYYLMDNIIQKRLYKWSNKYYFCMEEYDIIKRDRNINSLLMPGDW